MGWSLILRSVLLDQLRASPLNRYLLLADDDASGAGGGGGSGGSGANVNMGGAGGVAQSFTQADIDKASKAAAAQATKAANEALVAKLGGTVDDAASVIAAVKAAEEATKTETQRALDAATAAKTQADQVLAEAAVERLAVKVERKLLAAGVPEASLARATRLVTVEVDADDAAITAEVDTLKTELPALFAGTVTPAPAAGTKPVTPPAATGLTGKSIKEIGVEAAARHGIRLAS